MKRHDASRATAGRKETVVRLFVRSRSASLVSLALAAALIVLLARPHVAAADSSSSNDDNPFATSGDKKAEVEKDKVVKTPAERDKGLPPPPDTSRKRATIEMASYTDSDHVTVFTPSIAASIENVTGGATLHGSYLVDVVSAASVDIVSTASRRWEEVRHAGTLGGEYKPHNFGINVGGSVSSEPDYLSWGVNFGMSHDFDAKNTTLALGYGYSHDTAGRCGAGGACTPFTVFARDLTRTAFNGGVTQVINRTTVFSGSFDVVLESGDQSKVYRYVPMFSSDVAKNVPVGASIEYVTAHRLPERPLEQLPLSRHRFALTGRLAKRFDFSTIRLTERLYDDSWGLKASTTDFRWIVDAGRRFALWPHGRFHVQSPVSFWQRAYISSPSGWNLPEFRTGDRELGPLWTATGGAGAKLFLGGHEDPQTWGVALQGDAIYTSYTNDLYLTSRTGVLGSLTLEGEF